MLGWMLGGRGERTLNTLGDGDTTQIDQPDTPAPIFAARAFKSALFGTPAPKLDLPSKSRAKSRPDHTGPRPTDQALDPDLQDTPMKPQGILLTPGTATSRRKRVSFNHDALTTTKDISPFDGPREGVVKRTRLSETLEKARRKGINGAASGKTDRDKHAPAPAADTDSEWEEEAMEEDVEDDMGAHDHTLDLNEPHSQSGKYWKGEFERYRTEAAAELEKLVKYKQRAKSYAREKDIEAMQLAEQLKEEQEKVIAMEKMIAENASHMAAKQRESCSSETAELLATLTRQTALATESRHRVQELEEQLEDLLQGREEEMNININNDDHDNDDLGGRRRRTGMPSASTQRTLLETQRELRRARIQLKEVDALREQVSSLKAQLRRNDQRDAAEKGNPDARSESAAVLELRTQLRQARDESARKDEVMLQLKVDFEAFRNESEAHDADTRAVLERAHAKISDLRKEVKLLKAARPGEANVLRSWQLQFSGDQMSKDDLSVEIPMRQTSGRDRSRRRLDLAKLDEADGDDDNDDDDAVLTANPRTLRDKFQEGAPDTRRQTEEVVITAVTPAILAGRPDLAKLDRWQPFVPRSPRNRAHMEGSLAGRVQGGAAAPSLKSRGFPLSDLPGLKSGLRHKGSRPVDTEEEDMEVDLLQDRFAGLGGPEVAVTERGTGAGKGKGEGKGKRAQSTVVLSANTRSALPPERRAAAMARIEKRMADRASRREGYDKENMRP